jgi:hypothetical protein
MESITASEGGWFQVRPVLAVLDWQEGQAGRDVRIVALEGPDGVSLLPPEPNAPKDKKLPLIQ